MKRAAIAILLVEDEAVIALQERRQLQKAGYQVRHVLSGEEAVATVEAEPDSVDLILMDIDLGPGMDGTEAARRILKRYDIPLLFLSSHMEPEIVNRTESITNYGYVVKSSVFTVLDASIKMALKLFQAQRRINRINQELGATNEELRVSLESLERSNHELAAAERKFEDIFTINPDCISVSRLSDGTYIDVNDGFTRLTGYPEAEALGHSALPGDLGVWFSVEERDRLVQALARQGVVVNLEGRIRHRDGGERFTLTSAFTLTIEGEACLVAVIKDVTESREAARRMFESEERFRLAMSATTDGLWDNDLERGTIYRSPAYYRMLGYDEDVFRSKASWLEYIHPEDRDLVIANNRDCIEGRTPSIDIEFRMLARDGSYRWIRSRAMPTGFGADGRATRLIGTHVDITRMKDVERRLKESESKYRMLFEGAGDAIVITDMQGSILELNVKLSERLGYSREELIDRNIGFVDPSALDCQFDSRLEMIQKEGSLRFRTHQIRKDGSLVPVEINALRIRWEGAPAVMSLSRDISAQVEAEEAQRRSQAILESTMESQRDILIVAVDRDFNCLYRNSAYHDQKLRDVGVHVDVGANLRDNLPRDILLEKSLPFYEAALQGKSLRIVEDYPSLGLCMETVFSPIRDGTGAIIGATGFATDITARREREEELSRSRAQYQELIGAIGEGVCSISGEEVFSFANPAAERIFRVPGGTLVGRSLYDFLDEEGREIAEAQITRRRRGEYTEFTTPIIGGDGERRWLHVTASSLASKEGGYLGASVIFRDISEEVAARRALEAASEHKELLMKELQHRVKNSFTIVSSLLDIASDELTDARAKAILADTESRIKTMSAIYERLYLSERVDSLDFGIYVQGLARSIAAALDTDESLLKLEIEAESVELDTKRAITLGLIVNELQTNAIKHAFPAGGSGRVRIELRAEEGRVKLTVADSGPGLPDPGILESSPSMGMTLLRLLTRQLRGTLGLNPGPGTSITVSFAL
ncbi:MAG TPA: PAS domain S-box protein [Rectinemataceae bacterium]|nr:PAS domain S-box protein [Rectinemataceae bacterium]